MTIDISTLPVRSPAQLRSFVAGQRVRALRRPDGVTEPNPPEDSGDDYWRFLRRRTALEGTCLLYQTYDASGDENDWNLNIAPDAAHAWLLDPGLLVALGRIRVVGADDALHGEFTDDGLPIGPGEIFGAGGENQGQGPTCAAVGVYGVFCGDFGHGGRPEIHPFDAFWRRYHQPASNRVNWDLGVFQDDSDRFNDDWSKPPIDVELKVPFCVDFPVTMARPTSVEVTFVLRKSPRCGVIAKNTVSSGVAAVAEDFTGRTVGLVRPALNRLTINVRDQTGLAGRPFRLAITDVHRTSSGGRLPVRRSVWLSGVLAIRVAVGQDGFAYWNVSGPNSTSAATAPDPEEVVIGPVGPVVATPSAPTARRAPGPSIRLVEARPVPREQFSAVVVHEAADGRRGEAIARPRQDTLVDLGDRRISLGSFDLFARARPMRQNGAGTTTSSARLDVSPAIAELGGAELANRLRPVIAELEVDDVVRFDVITRCAPYRNGAAFGEERSALSDILTAGLDESEIDLTLHLGRLMGPAGEVVTSDGATEGLVTVEAPSRPTRRGVARVVRLGPFGSEPISVAVDGTVVGPSGLTSGFRAHVCNYRVVSPRAWVEQSMGTSSAEWLDRAARLSAEAKLQPSDIRVSRAGVASVVAETFERLDAAPSWTARQVAGAASVVARAEHLIGI